MHSRSFQLLTAAILLLFPYLWLFGFYLPDTSRTLLFIYLIWYVVAGRKEDLVLPAKVHKPLLAIIIAYPITVLISEYGKLLKPRA